MKRSCTRLLVEMIIIASTAATLTSSFYSCKRAYMAGLSIEEPKGSEEEIRMVSRFPSIEEIKAVFHAGLPDSGIVPVEVVVRNSGDRRLVIHHSNGLDLPEGFRGFRLNVNSIVFHPLRTVEALALLKGMETEEVKYSDVSAGRVMLGAMVAPYGGYLIYNEIVYGRFYRALKKHSLFVSDASGLFEPLVLDPGDEVRGYLYFDLPGELNPYARVDSLARKRLGTAVADKGGVITERTKSSREKKREREQSLLSLKEELLGESVDGKYSLELNLCFSVSGVDTVSFHDVRTARRDCVEHSMELPPRRWKRKTDIRSILQDDWFFALSQNRGLRKGMKLYPARFMDLLKGESPGGSNPGGSGGEFDGGLGTSGRYKSGFFARVQSGNAEIADCAVCGDRALAALNFKSSSAVFLWDLSGEKGLLFKKKFSRRIKRSFLSPDFAVVLSSSDFLYMLPLDDPGKVKRIKLGRDVSDVCIDGGTLYAVQENGLLRKVGLSMEGGLKIEPLDTLEAGDIRILGIYRKKLVLLRRRGKFTFSIAGYDLESGIEADLAEFPGSPVYYDFSDGKIFLQFTNGLFLRLRFAKGEGLEILGQGYVPFKIKAAALLRDGLCLIGGGGEFTFRPEGDYEPCSIDRVTVSGKVMVLTR